MTDLFKLILGVLASLFRSRAKLEAEILVLRQQINVLRRRASKRPHFNNTDRFLFVWLYRWFPSVLDAIAIVRPETIVRWHRAGFRAYWRWRSRNRVGRHIHRRPLVAGLGAQIGRLLLHRLKESAPARIITTASQAHQGAHIPFDERRALPSGLW